jgi:hypothetical protein
MQHFKSDEAGQLRTGSATIEEITQLEVGRVKWISPGLELPARVETLKRRPEALERIRNFFWHDSVEDTRDQEHTSVSVVQPTISASGLDVMVCRWQVIPSSRTKRSQALSCFR